MITKSIVIFASGVGSNAAAIIEFAKKSDFTVSAIITDQKKSGVLQLAIKHGIPFYLIERNLAGDRSQHELSILKVLNGINFNLIVLAGYNRILSKNFLDHFPQKSILNIHPSLLPKFPGNCALDDVWNSKEKTTGITIHYVDEGVDTGEVIFQESIDISNYSSREQLIIKTHEVEHCSYPRIILEELNKARSYRFEVKDQSQIHVYKFQANCPLAKFYLLAPKLFTDTVTQQIFFTHPEDNYFEHDFEQVYEISYLAGVTDSRANALKEILSLDEYLSSTVCRIETARLDIKPNYNPWVEELKVYKKFEFISNQRFFDLSFREFSVDIIKEKLIDLEISDQELVQLSKSKLWALSLDELKFIRNHFRELKRCPTDVELEILAQTWSEHCRHKIFNAQIQHLDDQQNLTINSLYKTYIKGATARVVKERQIQWTRSVFTDNAGIVRWDPKLDVCIKVETHNSPSALDPFAGALTGILGVNRDILGCGLGAKPIANTSVFCLPPEDLADDGTWPSNIHYPRYLKDNIHKGVQDGGNKSGIPTVNGAFYYHESFTAKPLVFCGTIGILPRKVGLIESHEKNQQPGDAVVMVGGRVGKDGIHGATFSSIELTCDTPSSVVQMGDPIMQKRMTDFILRARDQLLYTSITDNGAGGLSSSVGEMAERCNGAVIYLEKVPLKYQGLSLSDIMISESQERMTCSVAPHKIQEFCELAKEYSVEATVIGEFTSKGCLEIRYLDRIVASLNLDFLFHQLPPLHLTSTWRTSQMDEFFNQFIWKKQTIVLKSHGVIDTVKALLISGNIKSHENYIRAYDHEVGAATIQKPFSENSGPSDAAMLAMKSFDGGEKNGLVISSGIATLINHHDPKVMAYFAVDEAVRNALCTGADLKHMALVDNFCWPNPLKNESESNTIDAELKLGALVRTCQGLYEICSQLGLPLVSGKDSMKNDTVAILNGQNRKLSVSPTILITALAHCPDVSKKISAKYFLDNDLWILKPKQQLVPITLNCLQGKNTKFTFDHADLQKIYENYLTFQELVFGSFITGAHDVSEGGALISLIEMSINSNLGFNMTLDGIDLLFGEGLGMIIFSAKKIDRHFLKSRLLDAQRIGEVRPDNILNINGVEISIETCRGWYKEGASI